MKFVIPSYKRPDKLKSQSLEFLKKYNVDMKDVYIFIRYDDPLREQYEDIDDVCIITSQIKGIGNTHNFITEYFDEGEFIVELDDDLIRMVDKDKNEVSDLLGEINKMIDMMKEENISYGGIYQVDNKMFMNQSENYTRDLRYMLGLFRIRRICKEIKLETNYCEDFENCILHFIRDKKILKNNHLCGITRNYAKGGCCDDGRNNETEKEDKVFLTNKYPQYTRLFQRKNGRWDVRLKEYKS